MARRLLLLALPLVLVVPACTDDDSPAVGDGGDVTTTTRVTTSTSSSTTSSSVPGGSTSTTRPSQGTTLLGPAGTSGTVRYSLAGERSEFCYRIAITGATATGSHVHRLTGETVITLTTPGADGKVDTCAASDALLIEELEANPNQFYVDVHTDKGLMRGNLG